MLSFVESLKQIVSDVHLTGGDVVERVLPPAVLLQRLREHAVQQIAITDQSKHILLEWFTEGFFSEYVRVCLIHLHKLGIKDEENIYNFITKVINMSLDKTTLPHRPQDFEDQLASALFDIWDRMGDDQTQLYSFAQDRWLIAWNYQKSLWRSTSLGLFLLELSPVQASTFLLSIDSMLSTGEDDFRHIGFEILRANFRPQPGSEYSTFLPFPHRNILSLLGFIRGNDDDHPDRISLTPIGKLVINRILSKDNPLRDTAQSLIETEELGDTFQESSAEAKDILHLLEKGSLVDDANKSLIINSIQLYHSRKYLESLRVIYPSIEHIVNSMIIKIGERPEQFKGLAGKLQKLEQRDIISKDISSAIEVITARNKILHGNFAPPNDDYVYPLCLLALRYLRKLLFECQASI